MVVQVSVVDAEAAAGLIERVRRELEVTDVCFDEARLQVRIEVVRNPDRTLVEILNLLEEWLFAGERAPTNVEIDEHRYVLGAAVAGG